jgi:polyhydroxyalkanoate synthesis repressor PhaR
MTRKVKGNAAMQHNKETTQNQPDNAEGAGTAELRLIKKYPNRRLYDTRTSSYITLADVKELVLKHEQFQVVDAKSSEDLTRSILLQIILEEEAGGMPMFTSDLLSQLIRFYGNAMQGMVGNYLEKNMQTFVQVQKQLQEQSRTMYGDNGKVNKDLWAQFMNFQGSAMQNMMAAYMDQSKNVFMQMQEQLKNQTKNIFTGFPFPGFPGQPVPPKKDDGEKS